MKKVKVLDAVYTIKEVPEGSMSDERGGTADWTSKTICVTDYKPHPDSVDDLGVVKRALTRHELIHAFLFECGLGYQADWSEEQVDWIARMFPKLLKAFTDAGCTG